MRYLKSASRVLPLCLLIGSTASFSWGAVEVASNPAVITIPIIVSPAIPYPSIINIAVAGTINDVNVSVLGVSHTFPDDFGALLVGPGGQKVVLFNGAGDGTDIVNLDWTFDDEATGPLPSTGALTSGTFDPSNVFPADSFPAPAPPAPYSPALSVLDGTNLVGNWSLYVADFVGGDGGSIARGWSLEIDYTPARGVGEVPEPVSVAIWSLLGMVTVGAIKLRTWKSSTAEC